MTRQGLAIALLLTLSVYQAAAYWWDPLGVHAALNSGAALSPKQRLGAIAAHSAPFAFFALALAARWPVVMAAAVPYLALFCFSQVGSGKGRQWKRELFSPADVARYGCV